MKEDGRSIITQYVIAKKGNGLSNIVIVIDD